MQVKTHRGVLFFALSIGAMLGCWWGVTAKPGASIAFAQEEKTTRQTDPAALKRAKKQSKMLDELYKTAIVLITENYVTGKESLAAGDAFQALFKAMKDRGYHEVRLLDGTGDPVDQDNLPKDSFEKSAMKAILDGKESYEQVESIDGKTYLKTVTPIPVVMQKCVLCHANYEGKKIIGGLGIKLEIE